MMPLPPWIALPLCLPLAGCACGRLGTEVARQTLTPTAEVLEVSGLGLLLRPTISDGGVSFGYRRATYVYPRQNRDPRPVGQTIHWGWVPMRPGLPFFLGTRVAGLEFQTAAGNAMLHAGLADQSISFVARDGDSCSGFFFYQRPNPERTVLVVRPGPERPIPSHQESMNSYYHHRAWFAGLAFLVGGCAQPSHLVLQQKTSLGIDVSTDTTTARVHVDAGYNRETNTFVPKSKVKGIDGEKEHEAMSVISLNEIKVKFFGTHEVNEQFATGEAAQLLAKSPASLAQLTTLSETLSPSTPTPATH